MFLGRARNAVIVSMLLAGDFFQRKRGKLFNYDFINIIHNTQIKSSNFLFVGVAFQTMGSWCKESKSIINEIGRRLIEESGDIRAKKFLCDGISFAIQRVNVASVLGTHL